MPIRIDDARASHRAAYQDKHGTLNGEDDAWKWWRDPRVKCAVVLADRGRDPQRCNKPCESCLVWSGVV